MNKKFPSNIFFLKGPSNNFHNALKNIWFETFPTKILNIFVLETHGVNTWSQHINFVELFHTFQINTDRFLLIEPKFAHWRFNAGSLYIGKMQRAIFINYKTAIKKEKQKTKKNNMAITRAALCLSFVFLFHGIFHFHCIFNKLNEFI